MVRSLLFLMLALVFGKVGAQPQNYRFSHLTTRDGLPNDFILSIAQDPKGFIWLGTHLGISRYDGSVFRNYQPNPAKANGISGKHTSKMYCDKRGNLWIVFSDMAVLSRMDILKEKFHDYSALNNTVQTIPGLPVNQFHETSDSTLWIASQTGLYRYNNNSDKFQLAYADTSNQSAPDVYQVTSDKKGNIWFLSRKGLLRLNPATGQSETLAQIANRSEAAGWRINNIVGHSGKQIWFSTLGSGLYCYDVDDNSLLNTLGNEPNLQNLYIDGRGNLYAIGQNKGYSLYYVPQSKSGISEPVKYDLFTDPSPLNFLCFGQDKSGNVWIGSSQGLDMFSPNTGVVHYRNNPDDVNSISKNVVNALLVDNTDNLWISTYRQGVNKADLMQKPFRHYFDSPSDFNDVLTGSNVTSIFEDSKGGLWVGAEGSGVVHQSAPSGVFAPVKLKQSSNNTFSAIFEDSHGDIWVGNYGAGINKICKNGQVIDYDGPRNNGFYSQSVRRFAEDRDGNIWVAAVSGIFKWDRQTDQFTNHSQLYDKEWKSYDFCRFVQFDKDGAIWAGTNTGGLIRYQPDTQSTVHFTHDPGNPASISSNTVYAVYEDADGSFLVGTSKGLVRMDRKTGTFTRLFANSRFATFGIHNILPDRQGYWWLPSDNGLLCYSLKTKEIKQFNENDGLLGAEFNTTSACIRRNGHIYLGSPQGMISFDPVKIGLSNPFEAIPVITNLQMFNNVVSPGDTVNGRVILNEQIWATRQLELKYNENDFALEFSALHYSAPENNKYWYKLEGFNETWIAADPKRHSAAFTGLPAGHYTFRLRAANNDGLVCDPVNEVALIIHIAPPFWQEAWFKVLLVILIVLGVLGYIRYSTRRLKRINALLEKRVNVRTRELNENNVLLEERQEEINLQNEELHLRKDELEKANDYLVQQQKIIESQNRELEKSRSELEQKVTERTASLQEAMEKAQESDRLKSSFLSNMSHEIRTPMNAIIGFSSLLKMDDLPKELLDEYVDIITSNGQSLLVLINDILDLSKIQSGQFKLYPTRTNLWLELNELLGVFSAQASLGEILLILKAPQIEDVFIQTDVIRLKQVLSNLISNALKFTQKGYVEFGVEGTNGEITFYVKDTGIGIPESAGNSIFERFTKIEDETEVLFRGTGLGLSICRSIVDLWNGKIWYTSKMGEGTTFYFTHPNTLLSGTIKEKEPKVVDTADINLKGKTILVAEDEPYNAQLLEVYLSNTEAHVVFAQNGKEAVDYLAANPVDLVLMDIKMPVMDGLTATKIIKQSNPGMIVVAQTGYAFDDEIEELFKNGVDGYLAKPILKKELYKVISELLER